MNLQTLLGIELPLIQAPMAGAQLSAMTIAVATTGALGSLPAATLSPAALLDELQLIRSTTQHSFNVNFFCHVAPPPSQDRLAVWHEVLAPYYRELNIEVSDLPVAPSRAPFSREAADVLERVKPPVVSFHFGLPEPALLARLKSWGTKILSSATTVAEARWLEARGVDAIIAQGLEAGGHRGMFLSADLTTQVGTFALLPQIVRSVRVPVIAAGGIADARTVAAAMALGAAGVQVGTAFLLCPEATTTALHRSLLVSEQAQHTAITNLFSGGPARGLLNRLMRELGPMSDAAPPFPLSTAALVPLRAQAERTGSSDFSPLWSGQNASGCRPVPAAQIVRELMSI